MTRLFLLNTALKLESPERRVTLILMRREPLTTGSSEPLHPLHFFFSFSL